MAGGLSMCSGVWWERRPLVGTASCRSGCRQQPAPSPRPRPGWKGMRPWGSFKCGDMSGLSLILLCSVFMEMCVYRETPSMLATDRCFWTLSLVWLRMFLLGDEPYFSSSINAGDGYKASRLLKWSLWKLGSSKQPLADSLARGDAGPH